MRRMLKRRGLAGPLIAVIVLAGCSSSGPDADAPETSSAPPPSRSSDPDRDRDCGETTTAPTTEPPATRYQPDPAEVDGAAKRVAARAVEALPKVRQVTYTQYFGYLPPLANILVEADFTEGGGTTYAVEISQAGSGWQVDEIVPAEAGGAAFPTRGH